MCYRESFVLFPLTTSYPVAWTYDYHHHHILAGLGVVDNPYNTPCASPAFVKIECLGGDVDKWVWDDVPVMRVLKQKPIKWGDPYSTPMFETIETNYIPSWLEDNLDEYRRRVDRILRRLNPIRDMHEEYQMRWTGIEFDLTFNGMESQAVTEFQRIVNEYRMIEGFVLLSQPDIKIGKMP